MLESKTARLEFVKDNEDNIVALEGKSSFSDARKQVSDVTYPIPDIYTYIQNRLDITRNTICEILIKSDRLDELNINPQMFLDNLIRTIQNNLFQLLVAGVKYKAINNSFYEMNLIEAEEITYISNLFTSKDSDMLSAKTLYKATPINEDEKPTGAESFSCVKVDSNIESDFARDCNADENVKFFFKLPRKFKIPTPIGNYNPDWAVVIEEDAKTKVYFVAEAKGSLNKLDLRPSERMKIDCGIKHFEQFKNKNIEYKLAVTVKDLYS